MAKVTRLFSKESGACETTACLGYCRQHTLSIVKGTLALMTLPLSMSGYTDINLLPLFIVLFFYTFQEIQVYILTPTNKMVLGGLGRRCYRAVLFVK